MTRRKNVTLVLCALVLAAVFFLLPLMIRDTGSAMSVMLCFMPLSVLVTALAGGAAAGFDWRLTVMTMALFAPTIWIHYNESAWVYAVVYAAIALAGNALGAVAFKQKRKER